ncbi:polymorphic toxin-type HINT domain-containing protein [Nocardiopsis gilva]|nr:polymorphic toxin-type HINT domain-containing protein [Nocardiopsis gilva]
MLRRIHDPQRGASFTQYAAVVVLCAAILLALVGSGMLSTITSNVRSAAEGLFTSETPGSGEGGKGGNPEDGSDAGHAPEEDSDSDSGNGNGGTSSSDGSQDGESGADEGGGWLDGLADKGRRFVGGAADAGRNALDDAQESIKGLQQGVENFIDDPAGWVDNKVNETREDVDTIVDAAKNDPVGLAQDFFASDEAQERCRSGDRAGCTGMIVVENAEALIPIWGWNKKRERLDDLADAARRGDNNGGSNTDHETQADGLPAPSSRGSDSGDGSDSDQGDRDGSSNDGNGTPCSCNCPNSFLPGTPVLSGDGHLVPIEDIRVGDTVWAFDPTTGEEGPREVLRTIENTEDKTLVDISVTGEGGSGDVTATASHPFWLPELAEWVPADELSPGAWLRTSAGTWVQVTAIDQRNVPQQQVHNLTVEGLHTYFVASGDETLLVHNDAPERESSCPDWLREQREEGNKFNREREPHYTARGGANEVHVGEPTDKGQYVRLDSYVPGEEIVSRKYTQLGDVQPQTAIKYLREIPQKYGPGTPIADTPTNRRDLGSDKIGRGLRGKMILEVPPQGSPIPQSVIDEADGLNITIRDSNGKVYN